MHTEIRTRLSGVQRRLRFMRSIQWLVTGLFVGTILGLVLALLWKSGSNIAWWMPLLTLGVCGLTGAVLGLVLPLSWQKSAMEVDNHYQLKDRSLTALEFAQDDRNDPLRKLQVEETLQKLDGVEPNRVVPWRRPHWLLASLGTGAAVLTIMLWPVQEPVAASVPFETRQMLEAQAQELQEEMLDELKELAKDKNEDELDELVQKLEELVEELRDPAVDEREALAKLSLMQQSITSTMATFNLEQVDSAMQSLAESVESADALQPLAADLKNQDYEDAAEKLEKFDSEKLSNKEKRAVAASLKKLSQNLAKAKQGELSESTGELSEGLEKKNQSQCNGAACKLAGLCKKQSLRKSICNCLGNQLGRLSLCKSQCNKNGCKGTSKSDNPSNNWGTGATNKPFGELATKLDGNRDEVNVDGQQGDGPSEREIMTTTEAKQLASRSYKKRYQEFRKQAEAVLESEPLPLGHRQTVKQYFESIRPTESDTE